MMTVSSIEEIVRTGSSNLRFFSERYLSPFFSPLSRLKDWESYGSVLDHPENSRLKEPGNPLREGFQLSE